MSKKSRNVFLCHKILQTTQFVKVCSHDCFWIYSTHVLKLLPYGSKFYQFWVHQNFPKNKFVDFVIKLPKPNSGHQCEVKVMLMMFFAVKVTIAGVTVAEVMIQTLLFCIERCLMDNTKLFSTHQIFYLCRVAIVTQSTKKINYETLELCGLPTTYM